MPRLKVREQCSTAGALQKKKELESTFRRAEYGRTGSIIGTFLVYHLMQFTFQMMTC